MDIEQERSGFDVEAYASNFAGRGKIHRLLFIAQKADSEHASLEAFRLAADELKKGEDTAAYTQVCKAIGEKLGPDYIYDSQWVEKIDAAASRRQTALETDLNNYKTNLIKESIRLGHNELGNFYYGRGNLAEAFKCYVRARDYCTTPKHISATYLNAIRVSIEQESFPHVSNYVSKAEQTPDVKNQPDVVARLNAAAGLAFLHQKRFKNAALKFTEVSAELGSSWNEVVSQHEIALYGGLCGLAHFDRSELGDHIISNPGFREHLEVCPEMREMVHDFYGSRYASCLTQLEKLRPALKLDVHLHKFAADLSRAVRNKALVQYTAPFVSVHLPTMAVALNTTTEKLEKEVAALIQDGDIQARIDSAGKVLYKKKSNQRSKTIKAALQAGEEYLQNTRALLLRASLQRHDLIQKGPPGSKGGHRGGGGGGGMGSSATFMPSASGSLLAPPGLWSSDRAEIAFAD